MVAMIDVVNGTSKLIRLAPRPDVGRPVTNEGLALLQNELFLLPEDFGKGAKVLRYSFHHP